MTNRRNDRIMRMPEVLQRTGMHRATLYRLEAKGHFPKKLALSPGCVGFYETDVEAWIAAREQKADAA